MADCPDDLSYSPDHEWVGVGNDAKARVGITDYAAGALGDIVFVSLPAVGDELVIGDVVAELESTKSVSEVFSPLTGLVTGVNEALSDNPGLINEDPYGSGWLFELKMSDPGEVTDLMDSIGYTDQLEKE